MNHIRVRLQNAARFCEILQENGFEASWTPGAHSSIDGGCSDPDHCLQHPEANIVRADDGIAMADMDPNEWATIRTNCSGNRANKLWFPKPNKYDVISERQRYGLPSWEQEL